MSPPDRATVRPPVDAGGEVRFAEPWHAEVLAVAHALTVTGLFSPGDWAEALGAALRQRETAGAPDTDSTYYDAALAALERLVAERAPEAGAGLAERVEAWRRAYLATPHGQPVELAAGRATPVRGTSAP